MTRFVYILIALLPIVSFAQLMVFEESWRTATPREFEIQHSSYIEDADGDGFNELICKTGDYIRIFEADGDDSYSSSFISMDFDIDDMIWASGDIDDDGALEFWIGRDSLPMMTVFENVADDDWVRVSTIFLTGTSIMPGIAVLDEDADGDTEMIAVRNASPVNINVFDDISDDVFDLDHSFDTGEGEIASLFEECFDSDGDGIEEFFVKLTASSGGYIAWRIYENGSVFYDTRAGLGRIEPLAAGDIDNDGDDEILLSQSSRVLVLNYIEPGFHVVTDTLEIDCRSAHIADLAAVAGDEIIIETEDDELFIYSYDDGVFTRLWTASDVSSFPLKGISAGDWDNDGYVDFAFAGSDYNLHVYEMISGIACTANVILESVIQSSDCEEAGIVEICYSIESFCSDSSWDVSAGFSVYGDDFIDITDFTIYEDGDFGDDVRTGRHCFTWNAALGSPGMAGTFDFMLLVEGDTLHRDFYLDTDAPSISLECPTDSVFAGDSIYFSWAIDYPADSFYIDLDWCSGDSSFWHFDDFLPFVIPPGSGECPDVVFMIEASDSFCNVSRTSCSFALYETMDIAAEIIAPIDLNDDGRIITSCPDQQISWGITHRYPLDLASLEIDIEGEIIGSDSPWLSYTDYTLTFAPPDVYWEDFDSATICLNEIVDIYGSSIDTMLCIDLIFDLDPPFLTSVSPETLLAVNSTDLLISTSTADSICGFIDTYWERWLVKVFDSTGSLLISIETFDFPLYIEGLLDRSNLEVCAVVADDCSDYCSGNTDTICFHYNVNLNEPSARILWPNDINGDGIRVSACDDFELAFEFESSHGIDLDYIHFSIDGAGYHIGDLASFDYVDDSTIAIAIWQPDTAITEGVEIEFECDSLLDFSGRNISRPISGSFAIDRTPPEFVITTPADIITDPEFDIAIDAHDAFCDNAIIDSIVITALPSGLRNVFYSGIDTVISGYGNGDSIYISAYAHDDCIDTCGPNYADTSIALYANLGIPTIAAVYPDDSIWSSCHNQDAAFWIFDITGIDTGSIMVNINGAPVDFWEYHGDTIYIRTPDSFFTESGIYIIEATAANYAGYYSDTASIVLMMDFDMPYFQSLSIETGDTIAFTGFSFDCQLYDSSSGINSDSIEVYLDGLAIDFAYSDGILSFEIDTNLVPDNYIEITIDAADKVILCGANSASINIEAYVIGLPDLEISSIGYTMEDESAYITGTISNSGIAPAGDFIITVTANGRIEVIDTLYGLFAGNDTLYGFEFIPRSGDNEICFELDSPNSITESNEDNNIACTNINIPKIECSVMPDPFSPNFDNINDVAEFVFDAMNTSDYRIKIFDYQNRLIRELKPSILEWDGRDENYREMPQGIYFYIIEANNEIICKGTIHIAR